MITAAFSLAEQGDDMPVTLEYDMRDVPVASRQLIDSKIRAVDRTPARHESDMELRPHEQEELMFDLALACAELIALLKAAEDFLDEGHQLHCTITAIPDADSVLRYAYEQLTDHAMQGPPLQDPPAGLDPSRRYWKITPAPLEGIDWSVIGLTDYVAA